MSKTKAELTAPNDHQFEVSLFGPGKGEAVAVHLGGGDWITVDSCRDQVTDTHPVLSYFQDIGVDIDKQVHLVVGTHAHDDHVAGISQLFAAATGAKYVSSPAQTAEEFFAAVEADADIESELRTSTRAEFREVRAEIVRRGRSGQGKSPWRLAVEQKVLWERKASSVLPAARVLALSPSDDAIHRAQEYLAEGTAKADARRRLSRSDPNEFSVALWVEFGNDAALLGADLEKGPTGCGWHGVLSSHTPTGRASLHKVPHHGSTHAHSDGVWSQLLTTDVVSLVAPYRPSHLPRPEDVKRIVRLSGSAFVTALPDLRTASAPVRRAAADLAQVGRNVREPHGRVGRISARKSAPDAHWSVLTASPGRELR